MTDGAIDGQSACYIEPGGSWRPFRLVVACLVVLLVLDRALPGGGVPQLMWGLGALAVLGIVGGGVLSARRGWTVRVGGAGPDAALSVGRERVPLADVDAAHLRSVRNGEAGADAGAPVLGGGWSLPKGRVGLPLRLTDGRTVLVPTRDPVALAAAVLAGIGDPTGDTPEGGTASRGTLAP